MGQALPKPGLRPFLPADVPMLAAIFVAAIEGLTGDDYSEAQQEAWAQAAEDEEAFGKKLAGQLTLIATIQNAPVGFASLKGADHIVARDALDRLSFEGVGVLPNGVVYYGDENRPLNGTPGGAYFKFVPSTLRNPNTGPITDLSASPLASGSVYGLRLGKRSGNTDYGQGTEFGLGTSTMQSPALAARTLMSVSTSNPSQSTSSWERQRTQKALYP